MEHGGAEVASHWQPGLIALHGNQTEVLADTVLAWLAAHPLDVLEPEVVLVQSNGMAEWFKMRMAEQLGVCAAARVELPARFVWRSYRQVLGRQAVPRESPLDKTPMTWRLMRLLPQCLHDPAFAPIAGFLRPGEPERLLQLAQRLADLFDQYQIYRADWLDAWEAGRDVLPMPLRPGVADTSVPEGQQWQPRLWRAVLAELDEDQRGATRARLQSRVLAALQSGEAPAAPLARRVVVFGISQLPLSLLEFLAAMARHSQVLLAVPNPCRFHWADAIDGRELLRMARRRQPLRGGRDLAQLPLEAMHAHAHPLLAAWGRQSRDYVRQLDAFDTTGAAAQLQMPRVDLFDETDAEDLRTAPLLVQVQQRIRDLVPLAEHPPLEVARADRSIVFHSAHSVVRELEVLHDQLLQMLARPPAPAQPGQAPLAPRDVVVMLPSIETAAPSIRAVFGQYGRHDPRHIPFDIADLGARASSPLAVALQWLLRLPQQRCRLSELCDLLDVPAIAARMGLAGDDLPQLTRWMAGAGIRWGLNAPQRGALGLQACGEHNSAWFGLQRMLLGYAGGVAQDGQAFGGIEPYDEVGGLSAELAGVLAALLERMLAWWREAGRPAVPEVWAQRFRALLQDFFKAQDDEDEAMLAALDAALTDWQRACEQAGYADAVELGVAQEAWMQALEQPSLSQRFRAGGVTFCTLMPMRAIPFEVVCLLGMNDGDYPRRATRSDFDLMGLPGQQRPGDRARRDDDRQLMLEALLSARRALYISWTGHHVRDNSEQPPSVLVSQLRDYLEAGWRGEGGQPLLAQRTQQHPLQPFSRRYFEEGSPWTTYAREWRAAHAQADGTDVLPSLPGQPRPPFVPDASAPLTLARLTDFLRHPARAYLRQRLQVRFEQEDNPVVDEELFQLDGLTEYLLVQQLQQQVAAGLDEPGQAPQAMEDSVRAAVARLTRSGRLPLAGLGERGARALQSSVTPSLRAWRQQLERYAHPAPRRRLLIEDDGLVFDDWIDGLRQSCEAEESPNADDARCWLLLDPRNLLDAKGRPHADKLMPVYLRSLALAASGSQAGLRVVARDGLVQVLSMDPSEALARLRELMALWREGQNGPLPLPLRSGLAMAEGFPAAAQQAYEGGHLVGGECEDPSWARCYPDFDLLSADGRFEALAHAAHAPLLDWVAAQVQVLPYQGDAQ